MLTVKGNLCWSGCHGESLIIRIFACLLGHDGVEPGQQSPYALPNANRNLLQITRITQQGLGADMGCLGLGSQQQMPACRPGQPLASLSFLGLG